MKYIIINRTDGIPAGWNEWDTKEQAEECITKMRQRFKDTQGYYRDSHGNKLNPDDVRYEVIEIEEEV